MDPVLPACLPEHWFMSPPCLSAGRKQRQVATRDEPIYLHTHTHTQTFPRRPTLSLSVSLGVVLPSCWLSGPVNAHTHIQTHTHTRHVLNRIDLG